MATERVTEHADGSREHVVERDSGPTFVERGSGAGGVIVGIALLALVAIVAFFLLTQSRNDTARTDAVTGAATSVAHSADNAANRVGDAAQSAGDTATR